MTVRRFLVASLAAAVLLSSQGVALSDEVAVPKESAGASGGEETFVYTIVPHDTLWDISKRFLKNPFKWPKIWKLNPYIKNPDLIYPGNRVRIHPDGTVEIIKGNVQVEKLPVVSLEPGAEKTQTLEPEAEAKAPGEAKGPERKTMASPSMPRSGFVGLDEISAAGVVVGSKEKRLYAAERDTLFASFPQMNDVKNGDRFTVFKLGPEVVHPVTGAKLGNNIDILGYATVTGKNTVVEALIDTSYKEIDAGARLKPYSAGVKEVEITAPDSEVSGFIVASSEGLVNLSEGDIAYIDIGSRSGLKQGNIMRIFRKDSRVADPSQKGHTVELPPIELGTLVVVKPGENTSSCVVVKSLQPILRGDSVTTLKQ